MLCSSPRPAAIFKDPFRGGDNILVLCETYVPEKGALGHPVDHMESDWGVSGNNQRAIALKVFEDPKVKEQEVWFGIEQEYTLYDKDQITPLGFPVGGFPPAQGPYYCGVGVQNSFGRDIMESHLRACLAAGVKISGTNGEVMHGQWEYQIGPCTGIESGDHMWLSRYLMYRVCEQFGVFVTFHPKPTRGDWNGAGAHCNVSTKDMRTKDLAFEYTPPAGPYAGQKLTGGFAKIIEALEKMGAPGKPAEHLSVYGPHNEMRLTGKHETASMDSWSYGVANRGASIRIPRETERNGYGYFEDRRPASNIDPYMVTSKIAQTILL